MKVRSIPICFPLCKIGSITVKTGSPLAPMSYTKRSPDGGFAEENISTLRKWPRAARV